MMSPTLLEVGELLATNGYRVATEAIDHPSDECLNSDVLATTEVLLAEQPLLVVAVIIVPSWKTIGSAADGLVLAIADLVAHRDPSPRQWDLTVPLLLHEELDAEDYMEAASWASDTRHARRFVADRCAALPLAQTLAPVLPLKLDRRNDLTSELLDGLRPHLSSKLGAPFADQLVDSFARHGEVELP